MTVIYVVIIMGILIGFASLGVDWAEVQLAKTQLLEAADAAARAAAGNISNGVTSAQNAAVAYGGYNSVAGTAFLVNPASDIDFGTWNPSTKTFTILTGSARSGANAIRVWGRRTTANGNPIRLSLGPLLGASTIDMQLSSIAYAPSSSGSYGLIGLNSVMLQSSAAIKTDSYNASAGAYSAGSAGTLGSVATNGNMNLNTNVTIKQNIYMQSGQSLSANGSVSYGTRDVLSSTLVWPTPSAGSYATTNNNSSIGMPSNGANLNWSSGTLNIPSGNYYLNTFNITGGTVNISSGVTLYMNGNFGVSNGSTINVSGNLPANFEVLMVASAGVNISGGSDLYADIQAPTSPININGTSNFYGRLVGSSLSVGTGLAMHVDTSLAVPSGASTPSGGGSSGSIQIAQ
jgi:hypothetical protein